MIPISSNTRYTGTARVLHWLIAALMATQFIVAWTMPHLGRDTPVTTLISLHFSLGVLILAAAVVRLAWRMSHAEPTPEADLPPWQVKSARAVHWLLYLLLFVVPVLGWINASWRGMPVTAFGLFKLPELLSKGSQGWGWSGDVHGILANYVRLALIGLHVLAALYHRFVRHDGVVRRITWG